MVFQGLDKISGDRFYTFLLAVLAFLIPGLIYIYNFKFDLFLSLDLGKLILVCILYSTPIFILGILYGAEKITDKQKDYRIKVVLGASAFSLVIPIAYYIVYLGLTFKFSIDFITVMYTFSVIMAIIMILIEKFEILFSSKEK